MMFGREKVMVRLWNVLYPELAVPKLLDADAVEREIERLVKDLERAVPVWRGYERELGRVALVLGLEGHVVSGIGDVILRRFGLVPPETVPEGSHPGLCLVNLNERRCGMESATQLDWEDQHR